jgi:hypothetical protein
MLFAAVHEWHFATGTQPDICVSFRGTAEAQGRAALAASVVNDPTRKSAVPNGLLNDVPKCYGFDGTMPFPRAGSGA